MIEKLVLVGVAVLSVIVSSAAEAENGVKVDKLNQSTANVKVYDDKTTTPEPVYYVDADAFDYCSLNDECGEGKIHTMCMYPDETPGEACLGLLDPTQFLTEEEKAEILYLHNNLRGFLSNGTFPNKPQAMNLNPLVWDKELEVIARRWAVQCIFQNDDCRLTKNGTSVGQNLATSSFISYDTPNDYVNQVNWWIKQNVEFPNKYVNNYYNALETSDYTQMVWAATERMGCERVLYEIENDEIAMRELLVCLYSPEGNRLGEKVYRSAGVANKPTCRTCLAICLLVGLKMRLLKCNPS